MIDFCYDSHTVDKHMFVTVDKTSEGCRMLIFSYSLNEFLHNDGFSDLVLEKIVIIYSDI